MGVKSKKVSTYQSGSYSETTEFQILMCSNIDGNNNKFYVIEVQHDAMNDQWRLFSHYGRLDESNVYEARETYPDEQSAIKDMNRIVKGKCRPKKKKRAGEIYIEQYQIVDVEKSSIGSSNIREVTKSTSTSSKTVAINTSGMNSYLSDVIEEIAEANVHAIQSMTTLEVTDDGLKTPVGYLSKSQIVKAREVLDNINAQVDDTTGDFKCDPQDLRDFNIEFFSMIPHPFGRQITEDECIFDVKALESKFELLDQLDAALAVSDNKQSSNTNNQLGIEIELVTDQNVIDRIKTKARSSRASNHRNLESWGWEVEHVFDVKIPKERNNYENSMKSGKYPKTYHKDIIKVWHGSRTSNLLSILTGGLIIPPSNAAHVCGRAFGNGVYGATSSTKSLNYSLGFWGGGSVTDRVSYLLLCEFNLGKTYECKSALWKGPPSGYDSTYALAGNGSSLYNEEIIVYNLDQVTIKYLIKMVKR